MQASVESLKLKLAESVDTAQNVADPTGVSQIITILEQTDITKEILEATRIGLVINGIRKSNQDKYPDISKRCRNLIRQWQKVVEPCGGATPMGNGYLSQPSSQTNSPLNPIMSRLTPKVGSNGGQRGLTASPQKGYTASPVSKITSSQSNGSTEFPSDIRPAQSTASPRMTLLKQAVERCTAASALDNLKSSTVSPPESFVATGPLKLVIKMGPCPVVTTVSSDVPPISVVTNNLKESKKRKAPAGGLDDQLSQKRVTIEPTTKLNGTPTLPILTELSSQQDHLKRSKSAAVLSGSKTSPPNITIEIPPPDPKMVASSRPRLKSTLELVAEMTKESALDNDSHFNYEGIITETKPVGAKMHTSASARQLSVASHNQEAAELLKDSRQRKGRKSKTAGELTKVDADLIDAVIVENTDVGEDSGEAIRFASRPSSAGKQLEDTQLGEDQCDASKSTTPPPKLEATIEQSETHPSTSSHSITTTGKRKKKKATEPKPVLVKPPKGKKHDWYSILPPLDLTLVENVLRELTTEENDEITAPPGASPSETNVERALNTEWSGINGSISAVDDVFHGWAGPYHQHVNSERKILTMPYAEIGRPTFVEYKELQPPSEGEQNIIGYNYDYPRLLDHFAEQF